ncbi:hypothetical protein HDU81_000268 [Chytriomyces hyalinus]|nr:hypothetical protein HDU81_000268 [Chytriomyces hyalinus]
MSINTLQFYNFTQLAEANDKFRKALLKTLKNFKFQEVNENKKPMPNVEELLQKFLEEPMTAWAKNTSAVVVIDALDELDDTPENINLLLGTFLCLSNVKLFVTSRPEIKVDLKSIFPAHSKMNSAAVTPDGRTVVTGSSDNQVNVWSARTGYCAGTLNHSKYRNSVSISSDGTTIVSADADTVKVWETQSGTNGATLLGHSYVNSIAISSDGQTIVSGSMDGTVKVWNTQTRECYKILEHGAAVTLVALSCDGKTIAFIAKTEDWQSHSRVIWAWDIESGHKTEISYHNDVTAVAVAADGKTIVFCAWGDIDYGRVYVMDIDSRTVSWSCSDVADSIAITPDVNTLIYTVRNSEDSNFVVWDMRSHKCTATQKVQSFEVSSIAFTSDGTATIALCSEESTIALWNLQSETCMVALESLSDRAGSVTLPIDKKNIVSNLKSKTVNTETELCMVSLGCASLNGRVCNSDDICAS